MQQLQKSKPVIQERRAKTVRKAAYQALSSAQVAAANGRKVEAWKDVRKHYRNCAKWHFNSLALQMSSYLHSYFSVMGNQREAKKYSAIRKEYAELVYISEELERIYFDLYPKINNRRARPDFIDGVELAKKYSQIDNAPIKIHSGLIVVLDAYRREAFDEVIAICQDHILYLEEYGRATPFYSVITPALITLGRYQEAEQTIEKAIVNINKGSFSWSTYMFYKVQLLFYKKDYQEAYKTFVLAESKKQLNPSMKEQWQIVKGYIEFLIQKGKVIAKGHGGFKLGKFLNESTIFSSDKKGNNINIIILQLLLKDADYLIDKAEAIQTYYKRYKIPAKSRERTFLRMMTKVGKAGKAKLVENELEGLPNVDIEIIPFGDLWEIVQSSNASFRKTSPRTFLR